MSLTDKQNDVIDYLIIGNLSKVKIAERVGIAEKTIYNWLNNNAEFKAELQKRTDVFNNTRIIEGKTKFASCLEDAINNIKEIANDRDDPDCFKANKYIVDRNLGNTTTKIETNTGDNKENNTASIDDLINEVINNDNVIDISQAK